MKDKEKVLKLEEDLYELRAKRKDLNIQIEKLLNKLREIDPFNYKFGDDPKY